MHDGLGDEAAVERVAGRLYLPVAISASRLGLFDDAPEGTGQVGVGKQGARFWDSRPTQLDFCRGGPFVTEQFFDPAYGIADRGHERVAVPCVVDRVAHRLREAKRTELAEQEHPRVERSGNAGSEQPCARHEVDARCSLCGWRRTLATYYQCLRPVSAVEDDRDLPAGPLRWGSTTWRARPAATAASKALPPASNTAMPADEASQCVEATMPWVPTRSGLVVNTQRP